jgi:predicted Zn-dependent protease with MMP-like domain
MSGLEKKLERWAEREVERAIDSLPEEVRREARTVPVVFEMRPTDDMLGPDIDESILGLFVGEPLADRGATLDPLPAQILLFLENLWDFVEGDIGVFREEVRITYLHELGHYFGWDEDDLARREID